MGLIVPLLSEFIMALELLQSMLFLLETVILSLEHCFGIYLLNILGYGKIHQGESNDVMYGYDIGNTMETIWLYQIPLRKRCYYGINLKFHE